ncbi:MAG: GNAT family N-acetyltransferase [Sphingomonadaceae bacterium]|nr:GNAT family N-acetyltransferase [Sphingomonadaceae bacterium]
MTGPVLTTERLELWRPVASDHADLSAMMQSEVTRRFLGSWEPTPADMHARLLRNAGSWSLYGYGTFMVRERGQSTIVGNCGVFHSWRGLGDDFDDRPEAGWIFAADKAGQGYAGEVMEAALAWFDAEHGPRRTVCMIDPANAPSIRLAERFGYVPLRDTEFAGEPIRLFERRG